MQNKFFGSEIWENDAFLVETKMDVKGEGNDVSLKHVYMVKRLMYGTCTWAERVHEE